MQADDDELRGLTEDVYKMRDELIAAAQAGEEVTGISGDGTATAVMAPDGKLVDLTVDESVIDPDDPLRLTDAVMSAVNDAHRLVLEQQRQRASAATAGLQSLAERMRAEAARTRTEFAQTRLPVPPGARRGGPANPS